MHACSDHLDDDCFDSSWMLQSTLTYSERPIQRRLRQRAIPTKCPDKPVKEHFSIQREETRHKKEVCFSYSSETIN